MNFFEEAEVFFGEDELFFFAAIRGNFYDEEYADNNNCAEIMIDRSIV
jgi:hypothetical protein